MNKKFEFDSEESRAVFELADAEACKIGRKKSRSENENTWKTIKSVVLGFLPFINN